VLDYGRDVIWIVNVTAKIVNKKEFYADDKG